MNDFLDLLPEDLEYLDANHQCRWHGHCEGNGKYGLLITDFRIPPGFHQQSADLLILIPPGYPASPLDMFYLYPPLTKADGQDIGCVVTEHHFDRNWQRWSRHYPWSPGEDNLSRHVEYVRCEIEVAGSA